MPKRDAERDERHRDEDDDGDDDADGDDGKGKTEPKRVRFADAGEGTSSGEARPRTGTSFQAKRTRDAGERARDAKREEVVLQPSGTALLNPSFAPTPLRSVFESALKDPSFGASFQLSLGSALGTSGTKADADAAEPTRPLHAVIREAAELVKRKWPTLGTFKRAKMAAKTWEESRDTLLKNVAQAKRQADKRGAGGRAKFSGRASGSSSGPRRALGGGNDDGGGGGGGDDDGDDNHSSRS